MATAVAVLWVVASWLLLAALFFYVGRLLCRIVGVGVCGAGARGASEAHLTFWVGWSLTIAILQFWHLWLPVDGRASLLMVTLGMLGLIIERRSLIPTLHRIRRNLRQRRWVGYSIAAAMLIGFWACLALGPPHRPDTANYHLAAVRWNASYPIVPGLGNLHGRLAFNNSSFLYAAMLDVGPWQHRSHHLAHGLLAVVSLLYFLSRVVLAWRAERRKFAVHFSQAFCFPVVLLFTYKGTTSFQPDFITFLIGMVVSTVLFEMLYDRSLSDRQLRMRLFAICFLSAVGLTIKLSFLPLGLLASLIAIGRFAGETTINRPRRLRMIGICSLAAAISLGCWATRGVVLSGYVAYPSTVGRFEMPWTIPHEDVQLMHKRIVGYARHQGPGYLETLDNWDWVGPAIVRELGHPISVTIPILCILAAGFGVTLNRHRSRIRHDFQFKPWWFLLPSAAAIAFMLATAPIPRFAGAAIWVFAIGAMTLSLDSIKRADPEFRRQLRLTTALGLTLLVLGLAKAGRYAVPPATASGFAEMPTGETMVMEAADGLKVHVAAEFAWDAPLPNTPEFCPELALVRDGDLSGGFRIVPTRDRIAKTPDRRSRR